MDLSNIYIISPSGNFYGSEQVLYDFLLHTKQKHNVCVPRQSFFCSKLRNLSKHRIIEFDSKKLYVLYLKMFLLLLFKQCHNIYINEGGHIKYIRFLAKIFRSSKFIVHIRMIYDSEKNRIGEYPINNIKLVCISEYISNNIPLKWDKKVIHDPYHFNIDQTINLPLKRDVLPSIRIGLIGRFSEEKGANKLKELVRYLGEKQVSEISFHIFGEIQQNSPTIDSIVRYLSLQKSIAVLFYGYLESSEIYNKIDVVLHLCEKEGLGRVFFEAINHEIPFIGFKEGGLPEIAKIFQLEDSLITITSNYAENIYNRISFLQIDYKNQVNLLNMKKNLFGHLLSPIQYCQLIENELT